MLKELENFKAIAPRLVLASGSPNRLELLRSAGIEVIVKPQDIDEDTPQGNPGCAVLTIAEKKLNHYLKSSDFVPNIIAICLDTLVYFEGRFLGKPSNEEEALFDILSFSGKIQEVYSGYAIYHPQKGIIKGYEQSSLLFKTLTESTAIAYIKTGEWKGAAGGYRIQKTGSALIERIDGSWSNVIGMPLEALTCALTI